MPENNGGYTALKYGRTDPLVYSELTTDHPVDLTRSQVVNCYAGRIGLMNSGGESSGAGDLAQAVRTAVINKRAGGMGLHPGAKGVSASHERGSWHHQGGPGRLPRRLGDHRLTQANAVRARSTRAADPRSQTVSRKRCTVGRALCRGPRRPGASLGCKGIAGTMPITTGKRVRQVIAAVAVCRPASQVEEP